MILMLIVWALRRPSRVPTTAIDRGVNATDSHGRGASSRRLTRDGVAEALVLLSEGLLTAVLTVVVAVVAMTALDAIAH